MFFSAALQIIPDSPQLSVIAGAAAEITGEKHADFIVGGIGIFPQKGDGVHDKAGIAETTLVRALVGDKTGEVSCFLLQSFQRMDAVSGCPGGQHGAGEDVASVHQYGTEAAAGGLTASFYAVAAVVS